MVFVYFKVTLTQLLTCKKKKICVPLETISCACRGVYTTLGDVLCYITLLTHGPPFISKVLFKPLFLKTTGDVGFLPRVGEKYIEWSS